MAFLTFITRGECSVCLSNLGDDAVAHENSGELHPIHRKCLNVWINTQLRRDQPPFCPCCRIDVTSVETKGSGLKRLSEEGDLRSVKDLLRQRPSRVDRICAFLKASEAGHSRVVAAFLQNGGIAKGLRGRALQEASRNGHFEVVKVLFDKELIPPESLEVSIRIADQRGYQKIVERLKFWGNA